jgi:hypothetical protein
MMKRGILAITLVLAAGQVQYAQSLEDIVAIGEKPACTMADLSIMAPALVESSPEDTELGSRLEQELASYAPDEPLTKASASLVAARSLKLRSSFFFMLFPTKRYSFRAMVVDGVFSSTSSGGDVMSGVELLDFITMVSRKYVVKP